MMGTEISSFRSDHREGHRSTDLPCDTDRNQNRYQYNKGNGENCTEVHKESTPTPKGDGLFYKRRKLSRGGVAILQEKKPQDQSSDLVRDSNQCTTSTSLTKALVKGNKPSKSSKNAPVQKIPQRTLTHMEYKEICLSSILKDDALGDQGQRVFSCTFNRDDISIKASLPCKACEIFEESSKMLICDCCEAAYHLSCCDNVVKIIGTDEDWLDWYCLPCSLSKRAMESNQEGETSGEGRIMSSNPIQAMLVDKRPYRTVVRIGEQFQAYVPDWLGAVNDDSSDCFSEPKELDVTDDSTLKLWCNRPRSRSVGNWVQCQEILHANNSDEVTICGKWRRVPFEVLQTDDWDCSCLLPHDPFHADCAVPQEAENEEVIKQLKVLQTTRQLVENRRKQS
ncbi:RING/FYVE/PHD zinc finger superfamily protein [Rhynchospora pubera]|uniref:RING/FYVE/PHD zinc finger superfamily protein n=1 Tax=Rhynchospora pubera TaxID=906938 RepID=A0AAV8FFX5_9POAL|nr:RING/FYVE/PHD zinc finger superfamily protein [Rhynchospora pubera]KAJ4792304.1 RING/FYVE/PHD zinc finger superfamily protein [Rhynchospora pubera]